VTVAELSGPFGCAAPGGVQRSPERASIPCGPEVDRQVEELRASLADDPGDENTQMRLAEAESKAADCHVERARRHQADRNPREALKELDAALTYVPVHPEALMLRDRLKAQIAQSEQWAWEASAAAEEQRWRKAYDLATQALELDRTLGAAKDIRAKARGVLVPQYLSEARQALEAGRHAEAEKILGEIDRIDPGNGQVRALRSRLARRRQSPTTRPAVAVSSVPSPGKIAATRSAPAPGPVVVRSQPATRPTTVPATCPAVIMAERKPSPPEPARPEQPRGPAVSTTAPRVRKGSPPPPVAERRESPARPVRQAELVRIHEGALSRDDDRYPKKWRAPLDGIVVKLEDTDEEPLDADIEIEVGDEEFDLEDQRVGSVFWFQAPSGRMYRFTLVRIEDETETIWFTLDLRQ